MKIFALEIHAEGFPRDVGPFESRYQADDWAQEHIANGSWNVYVIESPSAVEREVDGL